MEIEEEKLLPTGKHHVSFSEVKEWVECPLRHYLNKVEKLQVDEFSVHLDYGTMMHAVCENYLENRTLLLTEFEDWLRAIWHVRGYDTEESINAQKARAKSQGWTYYHTYINDWVAWGLNTINNLPAFMEETFPEWTLISVEEYLYDPIPGSPYKFKGFVDAIIEYKVSKNRRVQCIIDWKTAKAYGWNRDKRRDENLHLQLWLYKLFWMMRHPHLTSRDVQTAFVLLKKHSKPKQNIELFKMGAGPKKMEQAKKTLKSMLTSVVRGFKFKKYDHCRFCQYNKTERCSGRL